MMTTRSIENTNLPQLMRVVYRSKNWEGLLEHAEAIQNFLEPNIFGEWVLSTHERVLSDALKPVRDRLNLERSSESHGEDFEQFKVEVIRSLARIFDSNYRIIKSATYLDALIEMNEPFIRTKTNI